MSRFVVRSVSRLCRATTAYLHTTPACNVNITFIEKGKISVFLPSFPHLFFPLFSPTVLVTFQVFIKEMVEKGIFRGVTNRLHHVIALLDIDVPDFSLVNGCHMPDFSLVNDCRNVTRYNDTDCDCTLSQKYFIYYSE